jgi:hypothetical protein
MHADPGIDRDAITVATMRRRKRLFTEPRAYPVPVDVGTTTLTVVNDRSSHL